MASASSQRPVVEDDVDSLAEEIFSPTDGYFSTLPPQPQDELIPDPEQENTPAAKEREAREAEEERVRRSRRRLHVGPSRRDHSLAASSIVSASSRLSVDTDTGYPDDERSRRPRLPTYDDAIAERPYLGPPLLDVNSSTPNSNHRQTGPTGGQPVPNTDDAERQPLLGDGNGSGQDRGWYSRCGRGYRSFRKRRRGRAIIGKILGILCFICVVASISQLAYYIDHRWREGTPVSRPPEPKIPAPGHEITGGADKFCPDWSSHANWMHEFIDGHTATFVQLGSSRRQAESPWPRSTLIRKSGEVHVVRSQSLASEASRHSVLINVDLYTSHKQLIDLVRYRSEQDTVLVETPRTYNGDDLGDDEDMCLYAVANVMVSPGANLSEMEVGTEFMSVHIEDTLDLGGDFGKLQLFSVIGNITFPSTAASISGVRSRDIQAGTQTGSVTGLFPLHDNLRLTSTAGQIDASVKLEDAKADDVKPASLNIRSTSGAIRVTEPVVGKLKGSEAFAKSKGDHHIPPRDYRTSIRSISGGIKAQLVHGSWTEIMCTSSPINATLTPYGDQKNKSEISVETTSSNVVLKLGRATPDPLEIINNLETKFASTTGTLELHSPSTWKGNVTGSTISGPIRVQWPAFHPVTSRDRFPFHYVTGYVGKGGSTLDFSTISGSTSLYGELNDKDGFHSSASMEED